MRKKRRTSKGDKESPYCVKFRTKAETNAHAVRSKYKISVIQQVMPPFLRERISVLYVYIVTHGTHCKIRSSLRWDSCIEFLGQVRRIFRNILVRNIQINQYYFGYFHSKSTFLTSAYFRRIKIPQLYNGQITPTVLNRVQGRSQNFRKVTVNFVTKQLSPHWTDFHEI